MHIHVENPEWEKLVSETQQQEETLRKLNNLIGLKNVKEQIWNICSRLRFSAEKTPGHYIFMGNSGTGKTEVARLMGEIFKDLGVLKSGHLVEVNSRDLFSCHMGQTGVRTREFCEKAKEGILLIDEAYTLFDHEYSNFSEEAIMELFHFMNNEKRTCIIFVGYSDVMRKTVCANPYIESRVTKIIEFPDYTEKELYDIFVMIAKKEGFVVKEDVKPFAIKAIQKIKNESGETFSNARAMRKLFEKSTANYVGRMAVLHKEKCFDEFEQQKYIITCVDIPGGKDTSNFEDVSRFKLESQAVFVKGENDVSKHSVWISNSTYHITKK